MSCGCIYHTDCRGDRIYHHSLPCQYLDPDGEIDSTDWFLIILERCRRKLSIPSRESEKENR